MPRQGGHDARLWAVAIFVLGLMGGLAGRLCYIQGMDMPRYRALAASQHFAWQDRFERRGDLLDCRRRVIATSVRVPSIFADPSVMEDKEGTARRLAEALGLDEAKLREALLRPKDRVCIKEGLDLAAMQQLREHPVVRELGDALEVADGAVYAMPPKIDCPASTALVLAPVLGMDECELATLLEGQREFVWVKRKATEAERKRVLEMPGLRGLGIVPEYTRTYPHGDLAAQLVGFVGVDEQGLSGVALAADDVLAGKRGRAQYRRDAAGRYISTIRPAGREPEDGLDVQLSLDVVIQGFAEAALKEAWELWAPDGAFAVVIDPSTGDVLAAASLPSYEPARHGDYEHEDLMDRSRARYVVDMIEPGSIMKAFVLSGALAEGLVTEQTVFFCENGVWLIGKRRFHDHHAYGNLTVAEVIIKSSNVGAAKIGTKLGPERLYRYLCQFGFGSPTGFVLTGENPGVLRPPSKWTSFSLPSICVGQEVCVNVLQMALAYGAIANDGVLMAPRVVWRTRRKDGTWAEHPAKAVGRAIPASIAQRVRRVLCSVVEVGTGKQARLPLYSMGGKTGTAQKKIKGGYSHDEVVCSFVAMAPIERPRLVCMVSLDRPRKHTGGRHFGGTVAAPVVGQIVKQSLAYLGVAPDKPQVLARLGIADERDRGTR